MRTRDTGRRTRDTGRVSPTPGEVGGWHTQLAHPCRRICFSSTVPVPTRKITPPGKLPHQAQELPLCLDAPAPRGQLRGVLYFLNGLKSTKPSLSRLHQGHRGQRTLYSEKPCFPRPHGHVFSPAQGAAGDVLPTTHACLVAKPQLRACSCRKPQPASRQPAPYVGAQQGESRAAAQSATRTWPSTHGPQAQS